MEELVELVELVEQGHLEDLALGSRGFLETSREYLEIIRADIVAVVEGQEEGEEDEAEEEEEQMYTEVTQEEDIRVSLDEGINEFFSLFRLVAFLHWVRSLLIRPWSIQSYEGLNRTFFVL